VAVDNTLWHPHSQATKDRTCAGLNKPLLTAVSLLPQVQDFPVWTAFQVEELSTELFLDLSSSRAVTVQKLMQWPIE